MARKHAVQRPAADAALLDGATAAAAPFVAALFLAPWKGASMEAVSEVRAVPGRGLEGDRYFDADGASAVTLIEAEALVRLEREHGIPLQPAEARRNLLTRGVALNGLVGREFRVGEVVLRGVALCEPCLHLQQSTRRGVLRGLVRRGGLRAEIVSGGWMRSGDPINPPPSTASQR
jgi:MOSC domain-containing protein YiiM